MLKPYLFLRLRFTGSRVTLPFSTSATAACYSHSSVGGCWSCGWICLLENVDNFRSVETNVNVPIEVSFTGEALLETNWTCQGNSLRICQRIWRQYPCFVDDGWRVKCKISRGISFQIRGSQRFWGAFSCFFACGTRTWVSFWCVRIICLFNFITPPAVLIAIWHYAGATLVCWTTLNANWNKFVFDINQIKWPNN